MSRGGEILSRGGDRPLCPPLNEALSFPFFNGIFFLNANPDLNFQQHFQSWIGKGGGWGRLITPPTTLDQPLVC